MPLALGPVRLAEPDQTGAALAHALAGGEAVLPLPSDPVERAPLVEWTTNRPAPDATDLAAVCGTSGSTGSPKAVMLSRTAIRAAVTATHERLGGPGDWVLALPMHYVAGLMVLARAAVAGTRVETVSGQLDRLVDAVDRIGPRRYLSLVPTQLSRALRDPATVGALARFDTVLLGGGPADPTLLTAAAERGIRVVTTYGMSETCGGCVYDGEPLSETSIELGPQDRISIAGPVLFSGYWGDPARTAETLIDGRLVTADRGRWTAGRLEVLGRVDDVIISAGHKIDLAVVEREIGRWAAGFGGTGVALAVPDPDRGSLVLAVVDVAADLDDLQIALAARLPRAALPRRVVVLDPLPQLSSGKPDRARIRDVVTAEAAR